MGDNKGFVFAVGIIIKLVIAVVVLLLLIYLLFSFRIPQRLGIVLPGFQDEEIDEAYFSEVCPKKIAELKKNTKGIKFIHMCIIEEEGKCERMFRTNLYLEGGEIILHKPLIGNDVVVGSVVRRAIIINKDFLEGTGEYLTSDVSTSLPSLLDLTNLRLSYFYNSREICRDSVILKEDVRKGGAVEVIGFEGESYYYNMDDYLNGGEARLYLDSDLSVESNGVLKRKNLFSGAWGDIEFTTKSGNENFVEISRDDVSFGYGRGGAVNNLNIKVDGVATGLYLEKGADGIYYGLGGSKVRVGDLVCDLGNAFVDKEGNQCAFENIDREKVGSLLEEEKIDKKTYTLLEVFKKGGRGISIGEEGYVLIGGEISVEVVDVDEFEHEEKEVIRVRVSEFTKNVDLEGLREGEETDWIKMSGSIDNEDGKLGFDTGGNEVKQIKYMKKNGRMYIMLSDDKYFGDNESPFWLLMDYWDVYKSYGRVPSWAKLNDG